MPVNLTWKAVALRLLYTVIAGALIGINRGEHGRAAGLRTTILVCVAASVSMIQGNLLMGSVGKGSGSFVVLDLMRLPLGILSGMGFIGAGAILRRGNLVMGITTAATLWFTTVMGLCFGGGQAGLGFASLGIGVFVLEVLKRVEMRMRQDRLAIFILRVDWDGPTEEEIRAILREDGYQVVSWASASAPRKTRGYCCTVTWRAVRFDTRTPVFLTKIAHRPGVLKFDWKPEGSPEPGLPSD